MAEQYQEAVAGHFPKGKGTRVKVRVRNEKGKAVLDFTGIPVEQVDQLIAQGQMPDQPTAEAYEAAVRELETSGSGQAYVVARANSEKLMNKVNQQIGEGMEKGATSSIITLS